MKEMGITNKVAIITGASSGIGKETARLFAREGARLVLISRDQHKLQPVSDEINASGGNAVFFAVDITQSENAKRIVNFALEKFGRLDILINAAGIIGSGTIENTTLAQWDYMLDINVRAVFNLMQAALPALIERKGNIVNVSSVTGLRAFPGVLAYCVSKAGLDQLTRCAALELASKGVRVNAVNPGVTVTELHRRGGMDDKAYHAFLEHSKTTHPLGRVGEASDIAALILFLASESASWITGVTYSIDGGRAQTCAR